MEKMTGKCGDAVTWTLENGVLRVGGNGKMNDAASLSTAPFVKYSDEITELVIEEGVGSIGNYMFSGLGKIESVTVPGSAHYIGWQAFSSCDSLKKVTLGEGVEVIGPKAFEKDPALCELELPSTLRAVDFKAFKHTDNVEHVKYAGTEKQWRTEVRVGTSSLGNACLFNAEFTYLDNTVRYAAMTAELGELIKRGGDGALYIVTPDLSVETFYGKSGDCTLIIFPDGQTMLIDAGAKPCGYHVVDLLRGAGITHLDYFVISHPHGDHFGGGAEMANYIYDNGGSIGTYLFSGFLYKKDGEPVLAKLLAEHGTVMRRDVVAGDCFDIGGVHIDILNPFPEDLIITEDTDFGDNGVNSVSLVMRFSFGDAVYLTAGDIYASRERMLVEKYGAVLRADLAKTNHHGLFTSNTDAWLDAVSPRVLISDSDDAPWTLFADKLAERGIPHYIVSNHGLCVMRMSRDGSIDTKTEYKF